MTSGIDFQSPLSRHAVIALALVIGLGWLALRVMFGPTAKLSRRAGLLALRGLVVLTLIALLLGPVQVDVTSGNARRPDVFFVVDGSTSMSIGSGASDELRYQHVHSTMATASGRMSHAANDSVRLFRFGHRLSALETSFTEFAATAEPPRDTDTRLAEALRQLSGRFGRQAPAAVVLFSDGRVRDAAAVEQLARHFGERNIPLSVCPVGDTGRGGDIAIVSAIAPERVRKFSDVPIQLFLRSFGYTGRRTEVQIVDVGPDGEGTEVLTTMPVTLRGGVQSVPLTFRSETKSRRIEVRIPEQENELTATNNRFPAEIEIDNTKIRVLYIEGGSQNLRVVRSGDTNRLAGAFSPIQDALSVDEDIECVTLIRLPGREDFLRPESFQSFTSGRQGFPQTVAELSAFDCVILSDVAKDSLTEDQLTWLEDWVENRGGGLMMAGGPNSFASGGWEETKLANVLPVSFTDSRWTPAEETPLTPTATAAMHPVWQILLDRERNAELLNSVPEVIGRHAGLVAKPTADVLASGSSTADGSVMVAGRFGRGRSLALAVPMTSPAAEKFLLEWGSSGNRNAAKFWRNVVYWLTENSSIGRRRLVAGVDKRFYRPGETIGLGAVAYDETAAITTDYSIWAMVEPKSLDFDSESLDAPIRWPNGVARESGEEGPYITWGEEFELSRNKQTGRYELPLELAERLQGGQSDEGLRVELTAYEGAGDLGGLSRGTQVDSTSLEVQILDDPFEQQNPFPDHDLLKRVAALSGGRVLSSPQELADLVEDVPVEAGTPVVSKAPLWSRGWLLSVLLGLLTIEWIWRRSVGLA